MIIYNIIMVIVMILIPFIVGALLTEDAPICAYIDGQLILWALFQVIAVPAIQLRLSFNALFGIYVPCVAVCVILGLIKLSKSPKSDRPKLRSIIEHRQPIDMVMLLAVCLIAVQVGMYICGQHLDEDDARWMAEANDALSKGKMYLYNPATGDYIGTYRGEMVKDVYSPWAMYIAVISRVTMIRPVVMAHTIYAPVLLILSYMVYQRLSGQLFKGAIERHIFVLSVAVINLFFAGNPYTQSVFTLTRIWQGKAVVAAVIIPLIYSIYLAIENEDTTRNWIRLALCGCAACLFSGMGISIALIMIGVLGLYSVVRGRWRRIGYYAISIAPAIAYGLAYYVMKG